MKAARIASFGAPDAVKVEDAPKPAPKAGELLVRVHASAVNPVDWKIVQGLIPSLKQSFPYTVGCDVSGVVEALGADVASFQAGDEVYAYANLMRGGAFAEYVVLPASDVAKKPKSIDHAHAAAIPLAALTAWQALFDAAKLEAGQSVLVHAGAGGVGHFAVQLAKWKGAQVYATASKEKLAFVKELGADVVIDYQAQKFEELVKDVDVVFDMVGGETQTRSLGVLKKGGFLVSIVGPPSAKELEARGLRGAGMLLKPNAAQLKELATLVDQGKVKPHVSATFPLADAAKALALSKEGHTVGKIAIEVVPAPKK
ncbi:MAG: NADP-dependent oxidoreductase [Planctomycetes bacterium]|nr:NADP-dependent oxidoreductase [Planctomycetota bacterium]